MPNLVVLAGIPGSGKSTWAKTFFDLKYTIISPDDVRRREFGSLKAAWEGDAKANNERVFNIFHDRVTDSLTHNIDVVADATNLGSSHRTHLRDLGRAADAQVHLVLFTNIVEAVRRNDRRGEDARVPDEAQLGMVRKLADTRLSLDTGEDFDYSTVTRIESFS